MIMKFHILSKKHIMIIDMNISLRYRRSSFHALTATLRGLMP